MHTFFARIFFRCEKLQCVQAWTWFYRLQLAAIFFILVAVNLADGNLECILGAFTLSGVALVHSTSRVGVPYIRKEVTSRTMFGQVSAARMDDLFLYQKMGRGRGILWGWDEKKSIQIYMWHLTPLWNVLLHWFVALPVCFGSWHCQLN